MFKLWVQLHPRVRRREHRRNMGLGPLRRPVGGDAKRIPQLHPLRRVAARTERSRGPRQLGQCCRLEGALGREQCAWRRRDPRWGSEVGGGFGHVADVEQVSGGSVFIRADNFSTSRGYTDSGWIADSAVDAFLHPHDVGPGSAPTGGGQPPTNPPVGSPPSPSSEHIETAGGVLRTWTNPANGGGQRGANIARYQSVQAACRLQGLRVSDGNTWWYEVARAPGTTPISPRRTASSTTGARRGACEALRLWTMLFPPAPLRARVPIPPPQARREAPQHQRPAMARRPVGSPRVDQLHRRRRLPGPFHPLQ